MFEGEFVLRFTLSKQWSVNCSAGKGGLTLHTKGFGRWHEQELEGRRYCSSEVAVKVLGLLPVMQLGRFPGKSHRSCQTFLLGQQPNFSALTWKHSLETQWVLTWSLLLLFVPVQKKGAGLYYFYLGCAFLVNEPQTFQIIHIYTLTKMYLPAAKCLQNSTGIFRYPRLLMSSRAGWPLILRSRGSKTNSYFARVLQDSTLSIH